MSSRWLSRWSLVAAARDDAMRDRWMVMLVLLLHFLLSLLLLPLLRPSSLPLHSSSSCCACSVPWCSFEPNEPFVLSCLGLVVRPTCPPAGRTVKFFVVGPFQTRLDGEERCRAARTGRRWRWWYVQEGPRRVRCMPLRVCVYYCKLRVWGVSRLWVLVLLGDVTLRRPRSLRTRVVYCNDNAA